MFMHAFRLYCLPLLVFLPLVSPVFAQDQSINEIRQNLLFLEVRSIEREQEVLDRSIEFLKLEILEDDTLMEELKRLCEDANISVVLVESLGLIRANLDEGLALEDPLLQKRVTALERRMSRIRRRLLLRIQRLTERNSEVAESVEFERLGRLAVANMRVSGNYQAALGVLNPIAFKPELSPEEFEAALDAFSGVFLVAKEMVEEEIDEVHHLETLIQEVDEDLVDEILRDWILKPHRRLSSQVHTDIHLVAEAKQGKSRRIDRQREIFARLLEQSEGLREKAFLEIEEFKQRDDRLMKDVERIATMLSDKAERNATAVYELLVKKLN